MNVSKIDKADIHIKCTWSYTPINREIIMNTRKIKSLGSVFKASYAINGIEIAFTRKDNLTANF